MRYDEQYINAELREIGEQEDANRIRWIPAKGNNKIFHVKKEDTISQWHLYKSRNILEVGFASHKQQSQDRASKNKYKLDFNANLKQRLLKGGGSSPSRICLRLLLPLALKSSFSEGNVGEQRGHSLPKIKKSSIAKNFLLSHSHDINRNRSIEKQRPQHCGSEKDNQILWRKQHPQQNGSTLKGRMMGRTCRQVKLLPPNSRRSEINNEFKECITFMK